MRNAEKRQQNEMATIMASIDVRESLLQKTLERNKELERRLRLAEKKNEGIRQLPAPATTTTKTTTTKLASGAQSSSAQAEDDASRKLPRKTEEEPRPA